MSSLNAFSLLQGSDSESVVQLAKKVEKPQSKKTPQTQSQDKTTSQENKPKRDQLGGTRGRGRGASRGGASRGGPRGGQRGGSRGRGYVNNRAPTQDGEVAREGDFSGRGRGSRGRGRGGYVPSKTSRPFDRSVSRTGRGKEIQKGGAGKNNWGTEVDPNLEHASTEEVQEVLATTAETTEESTENKTTEETTEETTETKVEEVKKTPEELEEEKQRSYEQFLKEQEDNKKRLSDIKNKFNKTKREPKNYDKSVLVQGTKKAKEEHTFIKLQSEVKPKTESQKQDTEKAKQAKKKSVSNAEFFSGVEMGRKPRGEYRGEYRSESRGGFRGRGNGRGRGAGAGRGRGRGKAPRGPKISDSNAFPKL